ncbi:MAG: DNRLRE domain-containing protein, partial [Minisyncoccales bacterium]
IVFGETSDADYNNIIKDTFININTENLSQETTLNTYTWPENEIANAILMKADLSDLSSDITNIISAKLYLYQTDSGGDSNYDLSVHRIINHNPVISEANGYTYDGVNNWSSSNHRSDGVPLAQGDISSALNTKTLDLNSGYKEFDITQIVNHWLENPSENYGLLINSDDSASSDSYRFFASTENSDSEKRPYVVVEYSSTEDTEEQNQTEETHPADINNDGVIDFSEINNYLDKWLNGEVTIDELLSGINEWRGL